MGLFTDQDVVCMEPETMNLDLQHDGIKEQLATFSMTVTEPSAAVKHAIDTAKYGSDDDGSDDSLSEDDSYSEEADVDSPSSAVIQSAILVPRRPSLCRITSALSDRRASAPSQRSPHALSPPSGSPVPSAVSSPRTPSISMRHDAALRSFQQRRDSETQPVNSTTSKARPPVMNISSIAKAATPRIEVVQVFDEDEESDGSARSSEAESPPTSRSAARMNMMATLGRGQAAKQKKSTGDLPRLPSAARLTPSALLGAPSPSTELAMTPSPQTPGTASPFRHQRNVSCPTPTSPYGQDYGDVHVFITPPTPRPQAPGSPVLGGSYAQQFPPHQRHGRSYSSDDAGMLLAPPAFELAPGKKRAAAERRHAADALAWMASWQAQQALLMTVPLVDSSLTGDSIDFSPGTPSFVHVQQQQAILAQQQEVIKAMTAAAVANAASTACSPTPPSSTSSSWWRKQSDSSGSEGDAPSSSVRRGRSRAAKQASSPAKMTGADSASAWRRKEPVVKWDATSTSGSVMTPIYLPPAKRAIKKQS